MMKSYESPEVRVIRYSRPVRTQAGPAFVNSAGVQSINYSCPYCRQVFFTLTQTEVEEDEDGAIQRLQQAWEAHSKSCTEMPPDAPYLPTPK